MTRPSGDRWSSVAKDLRDVAAVGDVEHVLPAVGVVLVGAEQAEVARVHVGLHDVAQERAHHARRFGNLGAWRLRLDCIVAEVRHAQLAQELAAVGVRIVAHATRALRRQRRELVDEPARLVEELVGTIALHPLLEDAHVARLVHVAHRHLMRAPVVLALLAVDELRTRPALGRAQHDHRPRRALPESLPRAHRAGCSGSPSTMPSTAAAICWCISGGS